jgi:hypothetical protein
MIRENKMSQNNYKQQFSFLIGLFCLSVVAFAQLPANTGNNQQIESATTPVGLSASDWASIQNQVKTGKYKAYPHNNGNYHASNPAHGWHIIYAADGTTTLSPHNRNAEHYHLALKIKSIGYGTHESLQHPQTISHHENTLDYQWNDILTERWINSETDLEQWFFIKQRPERVASEHTLTLKMALDSTLNITQNGNNIQFSDPSGTDITYNKLKVWDSAGRQLPATMQLDQQQLSLLIDDSTAHYPLTVDPSFQQPTYLKASNSNAEDKFGASVAISNDTVVIGALGESSSATAINGNQSDNLMPDAGAVYVFTRNANIWNQQAYLKASNTDAGDLFGEVVAISGNTLVVGASGESSKATGVNGDQNDNSEGSSGAVYVFVRTGNTWTQQAYLKASNAEGSDYFGDAVAISGDTIVVGAFDETSNARGINGDQTDNSALDAGAAYIFIRAGNTWSQQAYLKASNHDVDDAFGSSVAVHGNTVVVGATGESSNATGVNGDQTDNSVFIPGAAYVFNRTGNTWSQQAYLKASNTGERDRFGRSVAISDNTIIVGANGEASSTSGINSNQSNDSASDAGAAYVFTRDGNNWSQQAYLKASNSDENDNFGWSVAIAGDTAVVGAPAEASNATNNNGDQNNNSALGAGAAYVFTRNAGTWNQQDYLKASNTEAFDIFGISVAISNNTIVVGASGESSNATEINDNQTNNTEPEAGAAYTFTLQSQQPVASQGLWWTPSRPGSGFDIGINSNNDLYMIWYTYTNDDQPIWYLASGPLNGTDWNADLFEFAWDGTNTSSKTVGTAQLSFQDAAHATLDWTLNTGSGSIAIEHFVFDTGSNVSAGTWFETTWPGYGLTQVNQGDTQVSVLYFYDQAGQPVWTLGSGDLTTATIAMSSFTGSGPACQFEHSVASSAGTVTASFSSQTSGMLSTDINLSTPLSGTWKINDATITNLAGST